MTLKHLTLNCPHSQNQANPIRYGLGLGLKTSQITFLHVSASEVQATWEVLSEIRLFCCPSSACRHEYWKQIQAKKIRMS